MATSASRKIDRSESGLTATVRVRRAYFESRFGQLHVHHVMPAGGGFDEATTVLCIPGAPGSGRAFYGILQALGRDRSTYAPDLPGCGESDAPPPGAGAPEMAAALGDFLDSMRFRRVNLIAYGTGGAIAAALIESRRAMIGKVVLSAAGSVALPPALPVLQLDLGLPGESGARGTGDALVQRLTDFMGMN